MVEAGNSRDAAITGRQDASLHGGGTLPSVPVMAASLPQVGASQLKHAAGKPRSLATKDGCLYHFNSCKRRATSSALARLLKALMRK
jgi:hypothetical protein